MKQSALNTKDTNQLEPTLMKFKRIMKTFVKNDNAIVTQLVYEEGNEYFDISGLGLLKYEKNWRK